MDEQASHRRDFLKAKSAARLLEDWLQAKFAGGSGDEPSEGPAAEPPDDAIGDAYLVRVGRRAMACGWEVLLNAGQYDEGTELALAALDLVDVIESRLSIFREDSEISRLNRTAVQQAVEVPGDVFDLLDRACQLSAETDGAFDITSGPLSRGWGFVRREGRVPSPDEIEKMRGAVGSQHLELDAQSYRIRYARPGVEINLGAIGKGYALDRMAEMLSLAGVRDFMIHGGQSSMLARGRQGGAAGKRGWPVGLVDPLRPDQRLGTLHLRGRALGTSGAGTQYFRFEGRRYGHIIDPRTGWPAEGVLSATVLAPTATDADALATACYIGGPALAGKLCQSQEGVAAVLVLPAPSGAISIWTRGLREGDLDLEAAGIPIDGPIASGE